MQKDKHGDLSMLLGGGGGMKLPPLPYLAGEMADYDMVCSAAQAPPKTCASICDALTGIQHSLS